MKCYICGKEVVLVPSAAERARKCRQGYPASYYTKLFPSHAECFLLKRAKETNDLMRKIKSAKVE